MHKFTGWPRAGFISAVFPKARFIHIVRDGRAVANSWLRMPLWLGYKGPEQWQWGPLTAEQAEVWDRSGRSFVVRAGLLWQKLIDAHVQARAAIALDAWLEIRYEDITAMVPTMATITTASQYTGAMYRRALSCSSSATTSPTVPRPPRKPGRRGAPSSPMWLRPWRW